MDHLDIGKNIGSDAAKQFINHAGTKPVQEEVAQEALPATPEMVEPEEMPGQPEDSTYAELCSALQSLFDANFAFQFKVHSLHWNLIDPDYIEYHAFYDGVYEAANDAVDTYAEWLRRLDHPAPFAVTAGLPGVVTDLRQGLAIVLADTEAFIQMLKDALVVASDLNEQGLVNFLADQQDVHQKLRWFIKSILGN
jgi:starvation-inducible DNA-binding protein